MVWTLSGNGTTVAVSKACNVTIRFNDSNQEEDQEKDRSTESMKRPAKRTVNGRKDDRLSPYPKLVPQVDIL